MSLKEIIVEKLCSGRYFLTVICGLAFLYAVIRKILPAEATSAIISMVFVSYFQKKPEDKNKLSSNGGPK